MFVSITLSNDLEQFLQTHARSLGVPLETLLTRTIVERWDAVRLAPGLPTRETELLLRLQALFPPDQTEEYQALVHQSDAGTLSEPERERLFFLLEQRDHQNAERLEIIADLARLRGVPMREAMAQLGIGPD